MHLAPGWVSFIIYLVQPSHLGTCHVSSDDDVWLMLHCLSSCKSLVVHEMLSVSLSCVVSLTACVSRPSVDQHCDPLLVLFALFPSYGQSAPLLVFFLAPSSQKAATLTQSIIAYSSPQMLRWALMGYHVPGPRPTTITLRPGDPGEAAVDAGYYIYLCMWAVEVWSTDSYMGWPLSFEMNRAIG